MTSAIPVQNLTEISKNNSFCSFALNWHMKSLTFERGLREYQKYNYVTKVVKRLTYPSSVAARSSFNSAMS